MTQDDGPQSGDPAKPESQQNLPEDGLDTQLPTQSPAQDSLGQDSAAPEPIQQSPPVRQLVHVSLDSDDDDPFIQPAPSRIPDEPPFLPTHGLPSRRSARNSSWSEIRVAEICIIAVLFLLLVGDIVSCFDEGVGYLIYALGLIWQPMLITCWALRSSVKTAIRYPVSIAVLSIIWLIKAVPLQGNDNMNFMLVALAMFFGVHVLIPIVAMLSAKFVFRSRGRSTDTKPLRFGILQMMGMTAAVAVFFAVVRATLPLGEIDFQNFDEWQSGDFGAIAFACFLSGVSFVSGIPAVWGILVPDSAERAVVAFMLYMVMMALGIGLALVYWATPCGSIGIGIFVCMYYVALSIPLALCRAAGLTVFRDAR